MKDDLKKVKGLTHSRDLSDRVGAAMFMFARDFDLSGEETHESQLARWVVQNPMAVDQTMLALVATSPEILTATTIAVVPAESSKKTATPVSVQSSEPEINLDAVSDDLIVAAVVKNWSRVATKGVIPPLASSDAGSVTVTGGTTDNPFLNLDPVPVPKYAERPARE